LSCVFMMLNLSLFVALGDLLSFWNGSLVSLVGPRPPGHFAVSLSIAESPPMTTGVERAWRWRLGREL
jgi:hypothetical protein